MTEQRKSLMKLIAAVIIILLLPVLFFRFIGDDPTKQKINATRQIAVVNEDTGLNEETEASSEQPQSVHFGKEVAAALGDRSDYSWTVVNRGAAENGLATKKYDAIVYIPSDFSKDILSYDKERPQKATLTFSIQSNLNAVNKEKVQRELEDAQKSMNKKMSALYWNFVSQKVNNVRGEFDKIVNKESEFQNVMYNFYKPSSNDLAGEIKRQKDLIDELKSSMNEAQGTSKEKLSAADEAKNTLKDFADTVERYKQYQETQKKLLLAAHEQNQQQITTGLNAIKAQQAANQFSTLMSGLATGINQAKTQLGQTGSALAAAQQVRENQVPQQEIGMADIQSNLLDNYLMQYKAVSRNEVLNSIQAIMKTDRQSLTVPTENPGDDGSDKPKEEEKPEEEKPDELKIDLDDQRKELNDIAVEINDISEGLKEPENEKPDPEEPGNTDNGENPGQENPGNSDQNDGNASVPAEDGKTDGSTNSQNKQPSSDKTDDQQVKTVQTASSKTALSVIPLADENGNDNNGTDGDGGTDVSEAKERLNQAAERIQQIEKELQDKQQSHNEKLKKRLDDLDEQITKLKEQIDSLKDQAEKLQRKLEEAQEKRNQDFNTIYKMIRNVEQNILHYPSLDDGRKSALQQLFAADINTKKISDLMSYYNDLSLYEATLYHSLDAGSLPDVKNRVLKAQQGNVQSVLAIKPEETASWENLKNNKMETDEDINRFISGMTEFTDNYSSYIRDEQSGVLDELAKISESAANAADQLAKGAVQEAAAFNENGLTGTMALSAQDTVGREVLQMSDTMGHLSERQSGIISYTDNMQQSVNDVQHKADTLNSSWDKNVDSTKLIRNDVYGILGNALVDGQENGYVYDYLANPLKISGEVPEERTQNVPPVVILVIVLISSLLIGYFSSYYQNAPLLVKGALFGILNILVGLMISLFGLNIYSLPDDQTIKWSVFTILLLAASSAFIRAAFIFGSISGWIASSALILFYVAPLIDLIMPNFSFDSPVSKIYIDIQYGTGHLFTMGITVLLIITLITAALPLILRLIMEKTEESDQSYEA